MRHNHSSYTSRLASFRPVSTATLAMIDGTDEDDTTECSECLGLGGSWSYPNAMSHIWHECDNPRCIDGRVPL